MYIYISYDISYDIGRIYTADILGYDCEVQYVVNLAI